ncbi:hypothetical protein G7054_g14475 [Neopestalotiopsis clavispora]|nr:hypothetical protein G7054_g14475 [Neopestalotiopsis clavispora]
MSADVARKRNISEAFNDEKSRGNAPCKRPTIRDQPQFLIDQLPSSSIHPPQRPGSVLSSLAFLQGDSEAEQRPELYTYKPLGSEQIRLIRLHPGQLDDPIHCSLVTDSTSDPSSYEALSYEWGKPYPTHHVFLSDEEAGCSFTVPRAALVTPNLHDALKSNRRPDRPLVLWIDAICINQQDDEEKSDQIKLMNRVFGNADRVLVWLGNETTSTAWAISSIRGILRLNTSFSANPDSPGDTEALALALCIAWTQFARSSYFRRAWVIQEIALARRATFIRGSSQLDVTDFQMILEIILPYLSSHRDMALKVSKSDTSFQNLDLEPLRHAADFLRLASDSTDHSSDGLGIVGRRHSLFQLITQTSNSQATDPRDKVFALLTMANQDSVLSPISANYKLSLPQVCGQVVECEIESSQRLDILMKPWAPRVSESDFRGFGIGDPELVTWLAGKPSWICLARDRPPGSMQPRGIGPDLTGIARPFNASRDYLQDIRFQPRVRSLSSIPRTRHSHRIRPDREPTSSGVTGSIRNPRAIKNDVLVASGIEVGTITDISMRMADGIVSRDCLEMADMSFSEGCEALQNKSEKVWERLWRTLVADRNNEGLAAPTYFRLAFARIFKQVLRLRSIDTKELLDTESDQNVVEFLSRMRDVTCDRRMFSSNFNNYQETLLGLAPRGAQVGDRIVILFGCSVPTVIRPAQGNGKDYVTIVGEAYMHGKMHGEAFHGLTDEALAGRIREFEIV